MRSLHSAAVAVLMTFGTLQATAQQPAGPVPGTVAAPQAPAGAPGSVGTIKGHALTSTNGQAAGTTVRLRDAQSGRMVATQVSDATGSFSFTGVDPGSYIVEVVGPTQSVQAASSVFTLHAGETLTTMIKLPVLASGGILGTTASVATIVAAGAAAAGVLAVRAVGDPTCPQ